MERIVFISLFLGLVSGTQWVEMRANPDVKSVRLTVAGHEVATLRKAPWQQPIDLGGLEPKELIATGYDDRGNEVARASQILNLPRPVAELDIVVNRPKGTLNLVWQHREHAKPRQSKLTIDGKAVRLTGGSAPLPRLDPEQPHVIAAEMRFGDSSTARAERVIHGGFSDVTGTQLTAIAVSGRVESEDCFTLDGKPVRAKLSEETEPFVAIVKDPDPDEARVKFGHARRSDLAIDPKAEVFFLWPIFGELKEPGEPSTKLFAHSIRRGSDGGLPWLLSYGMPKRHSSGDRQFADAVAVAGVAAVRSTRRRAVILILGGDDDKSHYKPAEVRHYLASIGVPLFVWSIQGPRPDLADSWGAVEDISTHDKLSAAVGELRRTLDDQQVVWVATDPISALRVKHNERCGGGR